MATGPRKRIFRQTSKALITGCAARAPSRHGGNGPTRGRNERQPWGSRRSPCVRTGLALAGTRTGLRRKFMNGTMTKVLVNGAGGFIGGHLVERLKAEGFWVRAVDLKHHEFAAPPADEFIIGDLRDQAVVRD